MAEQETSIVRKADDELNRPENPLVSLFSKFTQVLNFRFPPPPAAKKDVVKVVTESKEAAVEVVSGGVEEENSKPVTVRFPDAGTTTVAPLKVEAEDSERKTNPVVLWQDHLAVCLQR